MSSLEILYAVVGVLALAVVYIAIVVFLVWRTPTMPAAVRSSTVRVPRIHSTGHRGRKAQR